MNEKYNKTRGGGGGTFSISVAKNKIAGLKLYLYNKHNIKLNKIKMKDL